MKFYPRQYNSFLLVTTLLVIAVVPACKTRTAVGMNMILPPSASVMDIPKDKVFLMASPLSQPMPLFPKVASKVPKTHVCLEIVVDESGAVGSVIPIYELPECPLKESEIEQRFVTASVEAVKRWQFLAAAICTFPLATPKTNDCSGANVKVSTIAIKVAYVFSFNKNGHVSVRKKRA